MKPTICRGALILIFLLAVAPATFGQGWSGCSDYLDYLHWMSYTPLDGTSKDVAVLGDRAYVAADYALRILDMSDVNHPTIVGTITTSHFLNRVVVEGENLYVLHNDGMAIYSLADPDTPVLLSDTALSGAVAADFAGEVAVVACQSSGTYFVDVSNPVAPAVLGNYSNSRYAYGIVVEGTRAYVTSRYYWSYTWYLLVLDFSNPASPFLVNEISTNGDPTAIAAAGNVVAIGGANYVQLFEVSPPNSLAQIASCSTPDAVKDLVLDGSRAWLACGNAGLVCLDLEDVHAPTIAGRLATTGYAYGLWMNAQAIYMASGSSGLAIASLTSELFAPVAGRWTTNQSVRRVSSQANMAFVLTNDGRIRAVDCADPHAPVEGSWLDTGYSDTRFVLGGRYAYVASPGYGLRVADVGNPLQMQYVGNLSFSGARDIANLGDKVFVATDYSLRIIDVSVPMSPASVSELNTVSGSTIAAGGRTVVVGSGSRLNVISIADPVRPRIVGTLTLPTSIVDLAMTGQVVYAAAGSSGLVIIDVSSPSAPVIAGIGDTPGTAEALSVSGNIVAVSDGSNGVMLFDVQDSAYPRQFASILESNGSRDVSLQADYLFSANMEYTMTLHAAPCPSLNRALVSATVGSLEDSGNLAAVRDGATAGHDGDLEPIAPPPAPGPYIDASFHHPEWGSPLGDEYGADIRAPYDLDTAYETWPLRVETNQSGAVTVRVTPNFGIGTGWGPWLRDLVSGRFVGLGPDYEYTYDAVGTSNDPDIRDFELIMGGQYGIPPLTPTQRDLSAGWSLVGMPLMPTYGQQTLGDVLLGDAVGQTYLFTYNANGDYVPRQASETVAATDGIWVGATEPFRWDMSGMPTIIGVSMPLRRGWNLVGYPLWIGTDVAGIRVDYGGSRYTWAAAVAQGLVAGSFFGYDGLEGAYMATTALDTWHGYWIAAYQDNVSLWFNYGNATTNEKFAEQCKSPDPDGDWALSIAAGSATATITIGADGRATDGFDALLDLPCPPASPATRAADVALSIERAAWGIDTGPSFLADFVAISCPVYTWDLSVRVRGATSAQLTWDPQQLPANGHFDLHVPSTRQILVHSLRDASSCSVPLVNGRQVVQVRLNAGATPVTPVQMSTRLLANHPNPFNPSTTISFNLAASGPVTLRVFDAAGRAIRTLALAELRPAGHHDIAWDGCDDGGRPVAGGVYFYRLDADGCADTRKMSLVK